MKESDLYNRINEEIEKEKVLSKRYLMDILFDHYGDTKETVEGYGVLKVNLGLREMNGIIADYVVSKQKQASLKEEEIQDVEAYDRIYSQLVNIIERYNHEIKNTPERNILEWIEDIVAQEDNSISKERIEEASANLFLKLQENGYLKDKTL